MTAIPALVPPRTTKDHWHRALAPADAFTWLANGWRDLSTQPMASLCYGVLISLATIAIVGGLFQLGLDYILFPALSGFMVVGPVLALGLYEKSRCLAAGQPVNLTKMIFIRPRCGGQIFFVGVLLCLLMIAWLRAAVIIYAVFFGLAPFPGVQHIASMLFTTPIGWTMLVVGGTIGGLFAAFSFAISTFSIPMMFDRRLDALTAMGTSMALVWNNRPVVLTWGAIVLALFLLSVATGMLGLIIVFPLLGHGTWHAYRALAVEH
ncbi:hypothetical protein BSZ19_14225 [Bradyrhizobium japonicum]|uniref:Cytochrome C oxidase subunit I n=1 Tax=Bradyrhizobium japonicum TaxID=375 RepID=A0A1Y2JR17_BRAJP|nr:DUF2189 domain-containing protein [Bradyrhizobium japonicum]OSJ33770.1 hypothetical protein BSZ19_14225 [Bradyrhizobium japonicum]